jgi:RNA polymerase sigma-70 factor (ECF subfamily)
MACRMLGDEADAADCLQDAFVAAVMISRRQQVLSWPAMLRRLVTSRALDRLRERRRHKTATLGSAAGRVADGSPGPLRQVQLAEQAAKLREAMAHLPAQQAAVFCMRMLGDLSYEQIAEALGISDSHVGVLLYRARSALRERFAHRDQVGKTQVHHD